MIRSPKDMIDLDSWNNMDDLQRIDAVLELSDETPRPTYAYLVAFIRDLRRKILFDRNDGKLADQIRFGLGIYAAIMTAIAIAGWLT